LTATDSGSPPDLSPDLSPNLSPNPATPESHPTNPYAVIRGQGGEGKTALAVELARWLVRTQRMDRAAFVSVERLEANPALAVLDAIGRQLLPDYSAAAHADLESALQPVERTLRESAVILVIDNLESLLLPPYLDPDDALAADARADLAQLLDLCRRLNAVGQTRLVFTTREPLPAPFDGDRQRIELERLDREDAVEFIERVLRADDAASVGGLAQEERAAIEDLVEAVHGHARTLSLLAPHLGELGVERTRTQLVALMHRMHREHPGSREQSLFASVELSLARLSPANRQRARVLGVFHGGVNLVVLSDMMEWDKKDAAGLAIQLVRTGLATPAPYNHLRLHPALCPYLYASLAADERDALTARWTAAMDAFVGLLVRQASCRAQLVATVTWLELPNAMALLDRLQAAGDAVATISLTARLFELVQDIGKPRVLAKIAAVRDAAEQSLGSAVWSHAQFEACRTRIEQQLAGGQFAAALAAARELHRRAIAAGETAYAAADYDLALACLLLGVVLGKGRRAAEALPLLQESQRRFESFAASHESRAARRMATASLAEQGHCLSTLGKLDSAAGAYEQAIERAKAGEDIRDLAVGKCELGTVRYLQRRYAEALRAYEEARETFAALGEPLTVATAWQEIGMVHQDDDRPEAAEQAYRQALAIFTQEGDVEGQATSLTQLGNLYYVVLDRLEDAASFYRQAAATFVAIGDLVCEGLSRNNLAATLRELRRYDEARTEIRRAIECGQPFGHAAEPWKTWYVLQEIETAAGKGSAAAEARRRALELFLAYRRDGGENHSSAGRLCHQVTASLLSGATDQVRQALDEFARRFADAPELPPLVSALQAILSGARARTLADAPDLHYEIAAEIHVLLDHLGTP